MKKTMLWGALFTLFCTQVQAEVTQQPTQAQTPGSSTTPVTNVQSNQVPVVQQATPNAQATQVQTSNQQAVQNVQNSQPTQVQTTNQQPVQNTQSAQPAQQPITVQPQAAPVINCEYKIPPQTKTIEQSVVLTWAEKATTQTFNFDPANVDSQVQKLKPCFTDQGWAGFNSALVKSGNVEAIKTQKLTVSSQVDGQSQVTEAKDGQWKITLPLHVVYQNDKEKVTQLLNINLTVGRKISGDLGIIQMIATPRTATALQASDNQASTSPADINKSAQPTGTTNTTTPTPTPNTNTNTTTPTTPANTGTTPVPTGTPPADQQNPSTGSPPTTNAGAPH